MAEIDLTGETIKGYELQARIGAGGFGIVYRAYQPLIKREIAIKAVMPQYVNNPNFIRRFEAEAQLVAHIEHIHIVPLYDYWRDQTGAYLVMRWMRGGSLHAELQNGLWSLADVARLVDQIAAALHAAHLKNVIHRDLKPANILLDEDGNAYLADFGIAKDVEHYTDWASMLEEEESDIFLGSPIYQSPEQIKSEAVSPQSDIYSFGIMLYEILTGKPPFHDMPVAKLFFKHLEDKLPPLAGIRPDLPDTLDRVIAKATEKDPAMRHETVLKLAADFRQAALASAPIEVIGASNTLLADRDNLELTNPYKGLRAFQEADAGMFYGREGLVEDLLAQMHGAAPGGRFMAVVGPSGSGKSSVIRAGLLPSLRQGALVGSENWFIVEMTPGTHPLEELEAALLRIAVNPPNSLLTQLRENERGLVRAVKRVLPGGSAEVDNELVLLIDQFEEVFTRTQDEEERAHFLKSILAAASDPDSHLRIIVTLRADFYDRPLAYPEFGKLMHDCTMVVLPLMREDLEQVIIKPAMKIGLTLESGLVESIVADVGDQPGALPLLQYALTELFERRTGSVMTLQAYRDIGGVTGALAGRATELYHDLDEQAQQITRQIFLRLVILGEGTEDTRRRVLLDELLSLQHEEQIVQVVIDIFGKYRLLTFDHDPVTRTPTVEVAHEALIRQWQLLHQWIEDSREDLRLQRRVTAAATDWLNAGRDPSFLATGTRLGQFETWLADTTLSLTEHERLYLNESLARREQQSAEEAARQSREAALERRSRYFLAALAGVLAVAAVIALVLMAFAIEQGEIAQQNADMAEMSAIEAQSLALISGAQLALANSDSDLAILLAMEANQRGQSTIQTRRVLAEAAYTPGTRRILQGHNDRVEGTAFSPDGRLALSGARDSTVILWELDSGTVRRRLEGHTDWVLDVAFSPDMRLALSASADHSLILWNVETGALIRRFEGHSEGVTSVTFSADGSQALSGSHDATLILWDVDSGQPIRHFANSESAVLDVALSQSGLTALSGNKEGSVILWNVESGQPLIRFGADAGGHTDEVWGVAYTPDETGFLSASEDRTMLLWRFESGTPVMRFEGHTSRVTSLDVSPDGLRAVSGSEDNSVILWDTATGAIIRRFVGHTFLVYDVAFSPDSGQLLSASWDGTLRLWDTDSGAQLRRFGRGGEAHTGAVLDVAFSASGETAVSASADGSLALWDVELGVMVRQFEGHEGGINAVAFNPDERHLASGGDDFNVIVWDVAKGEIVHRLEGHSDAVWALDFSPDGRLIASGSRDNTLILWDAQTGQQLMRLFGHTFRVTDVVFSPNGETLATSGFDNIIILWNVRTGQEIRRFEGHNDWIWSVAFSPDGRMLVSGSADNSLILWDVATGNRLRRFEGHSALVYGVAFSPDGAYVLSGSDDRSMILWDIDSGAEVQRFAGHGADVRSVAFSPDGKLVLSGSGDASLRLWQLQLSIDELLAWVEANRDIREPTCTERERYDIPPLCPRPTPIPLPGLTA